MVKAYQTTHPAPKSCIVYMHRKFRILVSSLAFFAAIGSSPAAVVFPANTSWKYVKGTQEASSPTTMWRTIGFNDSSWLTGQAPFYYENGTGYSGNTQLGDMSGGYTCIFMRKTFQVDDPAQVASLTLTINSDDGCIVWINGTEISGARVNMPAGDIPYNGTSNGALGEPNVAAPTLNNLPFLVTGENVVAVQAFNASIGSSSDFLIDVAMSVEAPDFTAPTIALRNPAPGTVSALDQIAVTFSEPVDGVDAADLLINGIPVSSVSGSGDTYTFSFPQPAYGTLNITWAENPGIFDQALPANAFDGTAPGAQWQYTLMDQTPPTVALLIPGAGTAVRDLTQIEVQFSEAVQGVDAADLLINNVPATDLDLLGPEQYIFRFPQPDIGTVQVSWASGHGIQDLSGLDFVGTNFSYVLDPNVDYRDVRINEIMAANASGIRDEDGDTEDWIELYNGGTSAIDLTGWYLTDNILDLREWRFPAVSLQPNSYLVVWASQKDRTDPNGPLHTNFKLEKNGEYLALVFSDGSNIVSSFAPYYPPQFDDASYGRDRVDPSFLGYFTTPTPGAANSVTGSGFGPEVQFSRRSGTFQNAFNLELSVAEPGFVIRYYLVNNSTTAAAQDVPSASSPLYSAPIPISATTQVRARAYPTQPGYFPGPPSSETYIQITAAAASFTSDLPLVIFNNFGSGTPPGAYTSPGAVACMMIFDTNNVSGRSSLTNKPILSTRMGFHVRGSSTAGFPKKSLAVETWGEINYDDRSVGLLGMPADSDWVFYAPNDFDRVMLHNPLPHELSRELGHYSSRTRFAEVFLKTATGAINYTSPTVGDYNGVYVIEEKIKVGKNRLDIGNIQPENTNAPSITGGYALKLDRGGAADDVNGFSSPTGYNLQSSILFVDPDGLQIGIPLQRNYVIDYIRSFENALRSPNFTDPETGYAAWIDTDNWIDNHILNTLPFNVDGYRLSGFFHKPRNGKLRQGPLWDFDRSQGTASPDERPYNPRQWRRQIGGDQGTDMFGNPTYLGVEWWQRLFNDPDFWQKWIDRWQEVRETTFATTNVHAIIDRMADEIREGHERDSTKWPSGDSSSTPRNGVITVDGYSHTFNGTFQGEVDFLKQWWADRMDFVDTNFLRKPVFSSAGGQVSAGYQVVITAPTLIAGTTIYYTLDGTDPRLPGGGISSSAMSGTSPLTVTINSNARLFARNRNPNHHNVSGGTVGGNPPLSSPWSGPRVETYYVTIPDLRVTEIMYHPADPPMGDPIDPNRFEYLELQNIGATPMNLNRFRLRGGVDFDFPNLMLAAGQHVVVVSDQAAFASRYNTAGVLIAGAYANNLGNEGDHIILEGSVREPIQDFTYNDAWYPLTDGSGFALQIVDANAPLFTTVGVEQVSTWSLKESWRPSGVVNGTPGADDPGIPDLPVVYVNEALPHTDLPVVDAIELYNPNSTEADIGGWFLSDSFGTPQKYRIPEGTTIPANGYRVFYESNSFGLGSQNFGLSSTGDDIYLFSGDAAGNLTGYYHGFDFGAQANGVTFGRYVLSTGNDNFVTQIAPTLGSTNSGPLVGPIVISEIMYHPPDLLVNGVLEDNATDEYLELYNLSGSSVPLYDPLHTTNTWHLQDAVDYTFPMGVSLPAGGHLLVVGFEEITNATELAAFRARNNVPPEVPVYGPWSGKLDNSTDSIELMRPDLPDVPPSPTAGYVPYILAERVKYTDQAPWPLAADGVLGLSLQRIAAGQYGNDPVNWIAAGPAPGHQFQGGNPPVITTEPENQVAIEGQSASFTVAVTGSGPFTYRWRQDGNVLAVPSSPTLTISPVRPEDQGTYSVVVLGAAGAATSSNASLTVQNLPRILTQPQSQTASAGANISLSVVASGTGSLSYQWRRNGIDVSGATSASLTVTDLQLDVNDGIYTVVVTDAVGSRESHPALVVLLLPPAIVEGPFPTNQVVASGSTFTISLTVRGTLPIGYYWRLGNGYYNFESGGGYTYAVTNSAYVSTSVLVITNAQKALHENRYRVGISNSVQTYQTPSAYAYVTVIDGPAITLQPTNQSATLGAPVTFHAGASGEAPLTFQWWHNDAPIAGATGTSYSLNSVQASDAGAYTFVASNPAASATSHVAYLTLPVAPTIVTQPADQAVHVCSNAVFTVEATGAPLSYQWWFNATNRLANETNASLVIVQPGLADEGRYSVVVSNLFGATPSDAATLTLLDGDSDGDGMSDTWELAHGLNPCDASDRDLDPDNDKRTNYQEFISGTDPNNQSSVLRVSLVSDGGGARIQFNPAPDVGYTIQYRISLSEGTWLRLTDILPSASPTPVDFLDDNVGAEGGRFYRIVTPIQ